jgi:nucleoside-diphosphate-sugar epimerase
MMKIFVAGTTGVLGRALIPLLLQKGYIVRGLARSPEKARALELAGVEAVQGDLLDRETIRLLPEMMKGCQAAVHIATAIPRDACQRCLGYNGSLTYRWHSGVVASCSGCQGTALYSAKYCHGLS